MAAAGVTIAAVIGCVGPNGINYNGNGGNGQGGNGTGNSTGTGTIGADSGLPCEIADVLSAKCVSCHGNPLSGGAPIPLMSYADLAAQKNGTSYAQISLDRMQNAGAPMPPGGGATAAEIQAFQAWIAAGLPMGTCGSPDGGTPDPTFQGDPTCPSGMNTTHQEEPPENVPDGVKAEMNPGEACIACHMQNDPPYGNPPFNVGGTVFATGKVLDLCLPPPTIDLTQAKVIITDKNGVDHTLSVNKVGNFHSPEFPPIAVPYKARVEYMGKTRAMSSSQTSGDCNKCHTASGTDGAPGRVALPQ